MQRMLTHRNTFGRRKSDSRSATALVEFSLVLPVFGVFCAGLMEFGHAYMVIHTLKAATRAASRLGSAEDISTTQVIDRAKSTLDSSFDQSLVNIMVKNASHFDTGGTGGGTDYSALPDVELLDLTTGDLFLVRAELDYDEVALISPFWVKGTTLYGQSVMRHE